MRDRPDLIVAAGGAPAAIAATHESSTIPIVVPNLGELVGTDLVASLAHPGGMVTGMTNVSPQLARKRLELLRETSTTLSRIAVFWNGANATSESEFRQLEIAADALGLTLISFAVRDPVEVEAAVDIAAQTPLEAVLSIQDALVRSYLPRIIALVGTRSVPAMFASRESVAAGGLMSYGANAEAGYQRSASYVDRILRGAKPGDLPVEQPTTFELIINLGTAQRLGLTLPQSVLNQATELIP